MRFLPVGAVQPVAAKSPLTSSQLKQTNQTCLMTRRRRTRRRRRRRTRRRKSSGTTTTGTRRRKTRPTTAFFISYYQMPGGSIEIAIIRRAREGSKNEIHQNLTPKKMSKSNQVHL